jgi:hypothetical protein
MSSPATSCVSFRCPLTENPRVDGFPEKFHGNAVDQREIARSVTQPARYP